MSVNVWRDNGGVALPYVSANFSEVRSGRMTVTELVANDVEVNGEIQIDGSAGVNGQVIRIAGGQPEWGNVEAGDIVPGLSDNVLVVNSAGTLSEWSNRVKLFALEFTTDANQTFLNYYSAPVAVVLNVAYEDGTAGTVNGVFQRVGRNVSLKIGGLNVVYGVLVNPYRVISGIPAQFRPGYGVDVVGFNDCHGECIPCEQVNSVGPVTTYCSGSAYVTNGGDVYVFTNVNRTAPASGSLRTYPLTLNYSIA